MDGHDDAPLGRAIELGEHDAGDSRGLGEHLGLLHAVLAGRRVEDEENLGDGGLLAHDALDLAELVHEGRLVLEPASGVDENDVNVAFDALTHRLESDRGGVGSLPLGSDDVNTHALAPRGQLVGGRGAERVSGPQEHGFVVGHENAGELADGCRLAGSIDADHEDHRRLDAAIDRRPGKIEGSIHVGADERKELLSQDLADANLVGR